MFLFSENKSSFCPKVEWLFSPDWEREKEAEK
jgi:hypothetical protein